jgi:hypothetical protein
MRSAVPVISWVVLSVTTELIKPLSMDNTNEHAADHVHKTKQLENQLTPKMTGDLHSIRSVLELTAEL